MAGYEDILSGRSWLGSLASPAPAIITFSFDTKAPSYFEGVAGFSQQTLNSYVTFTETERVAARGALAQWEAPSGIHFVEVAAGEGEIAFHKVNFAFTNSPTATGFAYLPLREFTSTPGFYGASNTPLHSGDVFLNTGTVFGGALTYNLLHEIGHAIGLKHPFDGNPGNHPGTSQTVMDQDGAFPATLGTLDLQAAASMYGNHDTPPAGTLLPADWNYNPTTKVLTQTWGTANSDIMGTGQQDVIDAGAGADRVAGFQKDDILKGGAGEDQLYGGAGNDTLSGGPDNDVLLGGDFVNFDHATSGPLAGSDTADYSDDVFGIDVVLRLTNNFDSSAHATGFGIGIDKLYDIDNVTGGSAADSITGDQYANILKGGAGNDTLSGRGGKDTLSGDNSPLDLGHDTFNFDTKADAGKGAQRDVITDFHRGEDKIDLDGIDAKSKSLASNQDFKWIGKAHFHHKAGELHYVKHGANVYVEGDTNGDGRADFQIQVNHVAKLGGGDFDL